MQCIIDGKSTGPFPFILRPIKGRAVVDYLLDDALSQRDITSITIETNPEHVSLINKHISSAYPNSVIQIFDTPQSVQITEDTIHLVGTIYTSVKLQDLIRAFNQFKRPTHAAFDKTEPKAIPFSITPFKITNPTPYIFNCGTGYSFDLGTKEECEKAKSFVK